MRFWHLHHIAPLVVLLGLYACQQKTVPPADQSFGQPTKVQVIGYTGHLMEPFISRNGSVLFFNNLNSPPENTNLHWATRINDSVFQYQGEVAGCNSAELDVVSTRSYATSLAIIYRCRFNNGTASHVQLVQGLSKGQAGWLNFDVEVSADGQTLYFADGFFNGGSLPVLADLAIAQKSGSGFQRLANSDALLQQVNTPDALEYAACISNNQLELYFTRLSLPVTAASEPVILLSTRRGLGEPFGPPQHIPSIRGFVEAATLSPDQRSLYYHARENGRYLLYRVSK
jgi:hypothetical protein